ncbi:sigma-54-dependent Fis family transcriptional regulator [Oceanobacillus sp. J11TS1]|uniref:sigma-54-dependent Fis family transcriptional regulator n=1 Tax=Oceanobacillus sp. J11TS1 TaxID=2807191 RepID=UPI001B039606|nr:sigma-54-dependent transcriptional regulator [Oceanobacillus sp. J11TS1]GIO21531.1 sigma-54-dependent Fis family transcriptional regulator [Oceanobacillus sp. J11TS1]
MIKALLIAPYTGMIEAVKQLKVPEDFQLDTKLANLEEAIRLAEEAESQGYDIIISRGGTAGLIEEIVSIPVVHIDITGYDMLRVFTLIQDARNPVAFIGFENICRGARTLNGILDYNIKMFTINQRDEVRLLLKELKNERYEIVIGDVVTVEEAQKIGLRGFLITSGKEAIFDAFDEARRKYALYQKTSNKTKRYLSILQSIPISMAVVDRDNNLFFNNLSLKEQALLKNIIRKKEIDEALHHVLLSNTMKWKVINVDSVQIELKIFPVSDTEEKLVGIQLCSIKKHNESDAVRMITKIIHKPVLGDSTYAKNLRRQINILAATNKRLFISGEFGTGKMTIAKSIHFHKFGQNHPLFVVNCEIMTANDLQVLEEKLSDYQKGTVIFEHIENIVSVDQKRLIKLIKATEETIQMIFLSEKNIPSLLENQGVLLSLIEKISSVSFSTQPLRKRKEDLKAFIFYYLSDFHTEFGNETLGIRPEALEVLKKLKWPGNFVELKKKVRELSLRSTGYYIEKKHVNDLLSEEETHSRETKKENGFYVPSHLTLAEMEQVLIQKVFEEERGNQTRTAKRLGMNRTTLWRKLNSNQENP